MQLGTWAVVADRSMRGGALPSTGVEPRPPSFLSGLVLGKRHPWSHWRRVKSSSLGAHMSAGLLSLHLHGSGIRLGQLLQQQAGGPNFCSRVIPQLSSDWGCNLQ